MRMTMLTLASVLALGCGSPCRDQKIAAASLGGPIGIIFAAAWQCSDEPQPQPVAAVEASGLQVPEQPDMATPPDLATPSPDLASHPADMATPPDLTPRPDVTLTIPITSWIASGQVIATAQDGGHVLPPTFNTKSGFVTGATFESYPLQLPPEAAQAKFVDVVYQIDATTAWAPTNCTRPTYTGYTDPSSGACLQGVWYAGWSVDDSAKQGPTYLESSSTGNGVVAGHDSRGQYVRVNRTSTYKLPRGFPLLLQLGLARPRQAAAGGVSTRHASKGAGTECPGGAAAAIVAASQESSPFALGRAVVARATRGRLRREISP